MIPITRPMTLGNMRTNGVRSLAVTCLSRFCHYEAVLDVTIYRDDVPVPAFGPPMVFTVCGGIGADPRSNWRERTPVCLFGAREP
jgi:hypothetical protein